MLIPRESISWVSLRMISYSVPPAKNSAERAENVVGLAKPREPGTNSDAW